jgi:Na+-translocating ferredoxin:NAD+ oxidoreductase RnfG subunit
MTFIAILIVILIALLIAVTYKTRKRDLQYQQKSTKETMSDIMKAVIRNEQRENLAKQQRFEEQLEKAGHARIETKNTSNQKDNGTSSEST